MRNQRLYLQDILAAIERIEEFVGGMSFDEFEVDDKTGNYRGRCCFSALRILKH